MNRAARIFWRGLKWFAATLALVVVAFIAINWFDDDLRPEVAAALQTPPVRVAPEQNLFFALIGAASVGSEPLVERGLRLWNRYRTSSAASPELIPETDMIEFVGNKDVLCNLRLDDRGRVCINRLLLQKAEAAAVIEANGLALSRYLELREYPAFQNLMPPSTAFVILPWNPLLRGKQLRFAQVAIRAGEGNSDPLIDDWLLDERFWRRFLQQADDTLIDKMVAVAAVSENLHLAGDVLRQDNLDARQIARVEDGLIPFLPSALSLRDALAGELRITDAWNRRLASSEVDVNELLGGETETLPPWLSRKLARFLFLPNATRNRWYDMLFSELDRRDALSCPVVDVENPAATDNRFRIRDLIRNPAGSILVWIAAPAYGTYSNRLCDLEGLRRVVLIQARARREGIMPSAMSEFMNRLPSELNDPYTHRPMVWDPDQAGISFSARDDRLRKHLPWPI